MSFVNFCKTVSVPLTPGQAALASVCFDGAPVDPEFADLFGGVATQPKHASILALIFGRASGKTTIFGAAAALYTALTIDLSSLRKGEAAWVLIVAPDRGLAGIALSAVAGLIDNSALRTLVVSRTADSITIKRADGHVITLAVFAASRGGSALRGKPVAYAVLEEAAFFRDATAGVVNDQHIFSAIMPRLLPGGKIVLISTPWLQSGLLYELYDKHFGKSVAGNTSTIVAKAPTSRMRTDSPSLLAWIDSERLRDPVRTAQESDADFLPQGSGNAFDIEALRRSIVDTTAEGSGQVYIGGDWGLVADMSSLCAAVKGPNGQIIVVDVLEMRPKKGQPLSLTSVLKSSHEFAARHKAKAINVDRHILEPARDALNRECIPLQLNAVSESAADRELRYTLAIQAFKDGRVQIPKRFAALTDQLARIVSAPRPGGGHKFSVGRADGNHADTAMAFLLAVEPIVRDQGIPELYRKFAEMRANGESLSIGGNSGDTYQTAGSQIADSLAARRFGGGGGGFGGGRW